MVSKAKKTVNLPGFSSSFESTTDDFSSGSQQQSPSNAPSFTATVPKKRKSVSSSGGGNSNLKPGKNVVNPNNSAKKGKSQKKKNNQNQSKNNSSNGSVNKNATPQKQNARPNQEVEPQESQVLNTSQNFEPSLDQSVRVPETKPQKSSVSEMVIDEVPKDTYTKSNPPERLYTEELFKPDEEIEKPLRKVQTLRLSWTTGKIDIRTNDLIFIGTQNADLILPSEDRGHPTYVSRRHALIESVDGKAWLTDLGSRNGTFLNGERIRSGRQLLRTGDDIRFGLYHVEVEKI